MLDNFTATIVDTDTHDLLCFVCFYFTYYFLFNDCPVESARALQDAEEVSEHKGVSISKTPIELKGPHWSVKVVPWIGGRIMSMTHLPSGNNFMRIVIYLSNLNNAINITLSFCFKPLFASQSLMGNDVVTS